MQSVQRENRNRAWWKVARRPIILATTVLCIMSAAAAGSASAAESGGSAQAAAAGGSSYNWATFHRAGDLQGWAANSSVATANSSKLGVKWATDIYGGAVDSPVVAYDSALGERLAYIGTQNGDMVAINIANGQIVWSVSVGAQVRSSPLVVNGAVFLATANSTKIYKLNATTGTVACTFTPTRQIEGSPVAATPPGGVPTVYFGANDTSTASGPVYALKQSNCSQEWAFTGYVEVTGSWDPLTYAVDAKGEPLILFGTSDVDSKVYAIDAVTGKAVWHYAVDNPPPHNYDVGAGVVATAPGVNGFADGMAYVESKYGIMYGLDLTTGALVWSANYTKEIKSFGRNISTPALAGTNLVLGDENGLVDLNAVTGKVTWHNDNPADTGVDSSPAIAGPAGSQVVAVGDLAGGFDVDSLATGVALYHYQTGQYITASPAVSGGDILIASADGFLYDFAVGGGNESTAPSGSITSPVDSSQVTNPDGNLPVTGSAADPAGIARVGVAVQESGPNGMWWDAATGKWVTGPVDNPATVASPGSTSSSWTFSYPVPASGGTYQVTAYTVSKAGQSSAPAGSGFTVLPSTANPQVKVGSLFVSPGGQVTVSGSGFGDSETATISLAGTQLGTVQTTASGGVPSTAVTIPTKTAFGLTSLTVTGQSSGESATAGTTIANQWAKEGHDATRAGEEPNDPDIFDSIAAGNGTYMNLAWAYGTGAPVSAPPVVAHTVAYVPDTKGQLEAVDVHSGAPLWTWSLASGAALDGAPAVDTGYGRVFVGANDGTLAAISTSTGKTIWSENIGAAVSAPVLGTGQIYVATSTGLVEDVSEGTGTKLWSKTLGHPVSGAPSLDLTAKLLVVGESNGDVKALSTSGKVQWTHSTGSAAVTAPPVIGGGTVYVGAGDSVYALNETTGAAEWSYATGGKIGSSFTRNSTGVRGVVLTVGSADGNLYGLDADNGTLLYKTPIGSPITGVASAYETYVFDTSGGVIGAGRITSGERLWKRVTTAGAMTSPVVVDGTIYAGGQDSELYAYTTDGQPPS